MPSLVGRSRRLGRVEKNCSMARQKKFTSAADDSQCASAGATCVHTCWYPASSRRAKERVARLGAMTASLAPWKAQMCKWRLVSASGVQEYTMPYETKQPRTCEALGDSDDDAENIPPQRNGAPRSRLY